MLIELVPLYSVEHIDRYIVTNNKIITRKLEGKKSIWSLVKKYQIKLQQKSSSEL